MHLLFNFYIVRLVWSMRIKYQQVYKCLRKTDLQRGKRSSSLFNSTGKQ